MYLENKFLQYLVKNRITIMILVVVFISIFGFNVGLVLSVLGGQYPTAKQLFMSIPIVLCGLAIALLAFYIFTSILKYKLKKNAIDIGKDEFSEIALNEEALSFDNRKYKLFVGCLGTYMGAFIIAFILSMVFGFADRVAEHITGYFFGGMLLWFPVAWKVLNKVLI